jgi:hypothetical protein
MLQQALAIPAPRPSGQAPALFVDSQTDFPDAVGQALFAQVGYPYFDKVPGYYVRSRSRNGTTYVRALSAEHRYDMLELGYSDIPEGFLRQSDFVANTSAVSGQVTALRCPGYPVADQASTDRTVVFEGVLLATADLDGLFGIELVFTQDPLYNPLGPYIAINAAINPIQSLGIGPFSIHQLRNTPAAGTLQGTPFRIAARAPRATKYDGTGIAGAYWYGAIVPYGYNSNACIPGLAIKATLSSVLSSYVTFSRQSRELLYAGSRN